LSSGSCESVDNFSAFQIVGSRESASVLKGTRHIAIAIWLATGTGFWLTQNHRFCGEKFTSAKQQKKGQKALKNRHFCRFDTVRFCPPNSINIAPVSQRGQLDIRHGKSHLKPSFFYPVLRPVSPGRDLPAP
jgi:hypothetical protein